MDVQESGVVKRLPARDGRGKGVFMGTRASLLKHAFAAALIGLLSFTFGAPAASAATVTNPKVLTLSDQVHHELLLLPWYGAFDHLAYQINGSEVVLSGQVISEHAVTKDDAAKSVRSIPGVTNVVNNIEVLPPSPFDNQIRRAEYRTVFSHGDLGRYTLGAIPQLHIIVKNGHVTLEGVVMNQMDKNMAGIIANTVPGVFSVENNLQIGG
jgi:hyperosmotically inducible periplasmic protein